MFLTSTLNQKDAPHRAFFDSFFPAQEKSHYGGADLPEPVERLARPTICMASTGDFRIDPITEFRLWFSEDGASKHGKHVRDLPIR